MASLEVDPIYLLGRLRHPDYIYIDWFSPAELAKCDALDAIPRYSAIPEMTHRPTVGRHFLKVTLFSAFVSQACLEAGLELDQPRIWYIADHHDDAEIQTGDIPASAKRTATRTDRRRMQGEELAAIRRQEPTAQKPLWAESIEELFREYREQKTIESKIVNYMDKWDGLYEAVNEVVCGENKGDFKRVVEEYKPTFDLLNKRNRSWQKVVASLIGKDLFEFPDPNKLTYKTIKDVDFSNPISMLKSLSEGNTMGYDWWLLMNSATFGAYFLCWTFPGWEKVIPEDIKRSVEIAGYKHVLSLVKNLDPDYDPDFDFETYVKTGLFVPPQQDYEIGDSFGDQLIVMNDVIHLAIERRGEQYRTVTGKKRARGKYYGPKEKEYQ